MTRTIQVIIGPAGEIVIEAVNFKGPDCEKATRYLEQALGVAGHRVKKPEYIQPGHINNQQKLGA